MSTIFATEPSSMEIAATWATMPGIVERGVELLAARVEVGARDRAERLAGEVLERRDRVLADRVEVGLLESALPVDPVAARPPPSERPKTFWNCDA